MDAGGVGTMADVGESESESAIEIARRSRSNLAFALACLPRERRRDMQVFYAFCRVVDDIADSPDLDRAAKDAGLARWRAVVTGEARDPAPLEAEVAALSDRYPIPPERFLEVIDGVSMDLDARVYETFEDLRKYCYLVASVVGLISIEIFGYRDPRCAVYAENLGYALQLTNILRDVWTDLEIDGRIYLPAEDLERFGYRREDLRQRVWDERFVGLMEFEAERAERYYAAAIDALPPGDVRSMVAAEAMRRIYHRLLVKMRSDRFRVFEQRYRVGKPVKAMILLSQWLGISGGGARR